MKNLWAEYCTVTTRTLCETVLQNIVLFRLTHDVKSLRILLYCHDWRMMWNRCADCCTVTTQPLCETAWQNMVLSRLAHECEIVLQIILLTRLPRDVKPLSRLLYCDNSHTIWNSCADYCTIMTYTQCETVGHIIVLSRLVHNVK